MVAAAAPRHPAGGGGEGGEEGEDDREDAAYRPRGGGRQEERGSSRGNRGRDRDWWNQDRRGSGSADGWLGGNPQGGGGGGGYNTNPTQNSNQHRQLTIAHDSSIRMLDNWRMMTLKGDLRAPDMDKLMRAKEKWNELLKPGIRHD